MKVINHQKGNYTFDDSNDGSVMYGTIYMTQAEFYEAIHFLKDKNDIAVNKVDTYTRDALNHVFNWVLRNHGNDKRICLGVCATELLFEYYQLPRYKKQNYVINITDKLK